MSVKRLNRYKVIEIQWLSGIENFVRDDFIFNSFRNFKSVKRFQNRSDVLEFWSLDNSSSKSILDVLKTIYLIFRKTIVQRVTVVKLGVYDGDGNYFGGVKVKVWTESTNVMIAGFRQCRDLIGKGKMFVKYEAKVASRLSSVEVEEF